MAGIYQIKLLADLGVDATVLDAAGDLGGTWYWNRYPGARFDSESYTYGFSFSKELLDEWHWKERFSGQPENLKYLNYVTDKFDLRKYMQFNCKVESMYLDDASDNWRGQGGGRARVDGAVRGDGDRAAIDTDAAAAEGDGQVQGEIVPHIPLAALNRSIWRARRSRAVGMGATGIQVIADIADKGLVDSDGIPAPA